MASSISLEQLHARLAEHKAGLARLQHEGKERVAKIAQLNAEIAEINQNINAVDGAMQDCEFWIKKIAELPQDAPIPEPQESQS